MRCWLGTEVEHNLNYDNKTVFVKDEVIDIRSLISILKQNNLVNVSIYFGAGEQDVVKFIYTESELHYLINNYRLIIETSRFYPDIDYRLFDNIIVRVLTKDLDSNVVSLKLRSKNEVIVCNMKDYINDSEHNTPLITLKDDGTFSGVDIIIYED